jgi:N-terminal domain of galactosyltransferase
LMTLWKDEFLKLGGYDEQMRGWGYQDVDLRHRCEAAGMKILYWDVEGAEAMQHDDELRNKFSDVQESPSVSNQRNIERSRERVKAGQLVANEGVDWGMAPVERVPLG